MTQCVYRPVVIIHVLLGHTYAQYNGMEHTYGTVQTSVMGTHFNYYFSCDFKGIICHATLKLETLNEHK